MNILVFGASFPNPAEPLLGIFNFKLLEKYPSEHDIKVVAPVPLGLNFRRGHQGRIAWEDTVEIGLRMVEVYRPRYLLLPRRLLMPLIGFIEFLCCLATVARIHKSWQIDLIHVNFAYPDGIAAMWLSRMLKISYVLTEHRGLLAETLDNIWVKSQLKQVYRSAAAVTTVSEYNARVLFKKTGVKAIHIPNGLDFERFEQGYMREKLYELVCVSHLIPAKGIQYLIEAISILKQQGTQYKLDIIGEGSHRSHLEKLIIELGLQQEVSLKGAYPPKKLEQELPNYDALVLPSLRESFGIVLIEAMAAGLPVIATRCGGPEQIVNDDTGILVAPGSAEALVQGIRELSSRWSSYDSSLIRFTAESKYSLDSVVKLYFQVYNDATRK